MFFKSSHCLLSPQGFQERSSCPSSPQTEVHSHLQLYSSKEPLAVQSDCNGSVSHNSDVRSEVTKSYPQTTLPFKKRKALLTDIFPAKGPQIHESRNFSCGTLPANAFINSHSSCTIPLSNNAFDRFRSLQQDSLILSHEVLSNNLTVKQWSCSDVCEWAFHTLQRVGATPCEKYEILQKLDGVDGEKLLRFSDEDWRAVSENLGPVLLLALSHSIEGRLNFVINNNVSPEKKKAARKRGGECVGQLWEFIFKMLQDPATNPSVICWEDENRRLFRIVNTEKLAHLWGKRKGKPYLTYANMSRTMRYYRKGEGAFIPDDRKRVYGFGPRANIDKLKSVKGN